MSSVPLPALQILLIEDDPGDTVLVTEALAAHRLPSHLHTAPDAATALSMLRADPDAAPAVRPHLILLDLNMPGMDGRELLTILKDDAHLRGIPAVVFTASAADADIDVSYRAHANAYVTKPLTADEFAAAVAHIHSFYGGLAARAPINIAGQDAT
ncbi:response regulator [Micromonospora sp. CPCC 205556]|uniref:response regulator n=1 Tax=Micromonospora sp. CPCC 205556 TaxID=3122398 RepID=UPI002FEF773A